ncbi:MAG: CusA/CzcA family heavy metal efflux RND transporter, partial [Chitinophagales bacterium]
KAAIGIFTLVLIIYGSYSLTQLPIDAVPDITNNQVQVITVCPTLASQEVEQFVTASIERSMATLPDRTEIRSISRFGLSVVTIVFKDNVNIYFARQLVTERLKEAEGEIPPGAGTPELAPVSTGLGEIYQYVIRPDSGYENKYNASDLRTMQDWIVARRLLGTPGIAEVNSFGGKLKQYEVAVDPVKLKSMDVTIPEVFEALENNNENTGGAYIDKKPNAYFIRGLGLVSTLEDIGKIVVKTNQNGTPTLIRDVANVQLGSAIRYGAMTRNGEGEVVGGVVMMLKGANSAEVVSAVKKMIPSIQKSLPEGVVIEPYLDRTVLVNKSIETVQHNLLEGALIVIFVLVLFLGNFRAGLIVASLIPLSMLFAFIMMNLFGVSGNLMSLGAIDFGLIVDGAVIIVEAILHRISQSHHHHKGIALLNKEEMNDEVYAASSGVANSSTFGQIIILIVYIPILSLIGIEGKMFRPMAMTVSFAIIGALILSLTYVPMMSALFISKKTSHKKNFSDRLMDFFQRIYSPVINFAIRRKTVVISISVFLLAVSIFIFSRLGGEFIPTLEEGSFTFSCVLPQGSSLTQSIENALEVEKILKKFPEVIDVIGKTGTAEIPTDPEPVQATDVTIILKDQSEWTTAHSRETLQDTMIQALQIIPGVFFEASQPIQMRFNELMTGVKQDIAVKIFGENIDSLAHYADEAAKVISTVNGAGNPKVEKVSGLPQITIVYNRDRMAQYSLNVKDLNRIVRTAFAGESAGLVFENERRFDLVVRLNENQRQDIEDVRNLYVPLPSGGQIPMQQVALVDYVNGPAQISREDAKRRITLGINVRGRDVKSVVDEISQKLGKHIKLPSGYYFTYGGQFENLVQATKRLEIAVPVALLLIFVLLYIAFGSAKQALLIYSAIPFSAIGGIFALWIRGLNFSISAGVGFIALFGVAVLFGIVLVNFFNRLEAEGMEDVEERVKHGTKAILRPVLMASFLAAFGFLPMALATSQGAEVQRPLATVVIGGIFSATALTLIVLPALYILFSRKRKLNQSSNMTAKIITAVVILGAFASQAKAQSYPQSQTVIMSLDSVISMAMKNNPVLQSAQLSVIQQEKLKKTAWDFGKTGVFYENEDLIKSDNADKGILKIGFTQTIDFPTTYVAQSKFNKQNVVVSQTAFTLAQKDILRNVRSGYFNLWFAVEKQKLLQQQDSIFADFENAATLRFNTGETNKLEMISAQAKHKEIQLNLQSANADLVIAQQELMKLLNYQQYILPVNETMKKLQSPVAVSQSPVSNHPWLNLYQQKITLADYQKKVEINKFLPDFSMRYFNQNWFGISPGYYGYSFGVGIPLFFWAQQGKIQGAKLQQQIAQKDFEAVTLQFNTAYNQAVQELNKQLGLLSYYENTGLQQANEILNAATLAFKNGEIGYIEYFTLLLQSLDIKNNYLSSLVNYNQAVIQINFYINQ